MPCHTISRVSVEVSSFNVDLLGAALKALGHRDTYVDTANNRITFGGGRSYEGATTTLRVRAQADVVAIKKAYAAEIIKSQAKRFGWQLKQTGAFQYEVVKR